MILENNFIQAYEKGTKFQHKKSGEIFIYEKSIISTKSSILFLGDLKKTIPNAILELNYEKIV
jgi:hypothetical protein